jgi:hypothetical protein
MAKAPPPSTTKGAEHAVPCPYCAHPNDFRELAEHRYEQGDMAICDKCNGVMEVTGKTSITVIHVRKRPDLRAQPKTGTRQATTISPGQVRRLLR